MAKKKNTQKKNNKTSKSKKSAQEKTKEMASKANQGEDKIKTAKISKNSKKSNSKKVDKKTPTKAKKDTKTNKVKNETSKKKEVTKIVTEVKPTQSNLETISNSNLSTKNKKLTVKKVLPIILGILTVSLFAVFNLYVIPEVLLTQTEDFKFKQKEEEMNRLRQEREVKLEERILTEDEILNFKENQTWKMEMEIAEFGVLEIESRQEFAPKTVENFVRLVYRGFYNGTRFDKIFQQDEFNIIQGGTDLKTGQGKSAFFIDEQNPGYIQGELWNIPPQFESRDGKNVLINEAELNYPELYGKFNADTGTLEYPQGLLVAYSELGPDSISSEFSIILDKTIAPAEFVAFAKISENSFNVLEKIRNEVNSKTDETGQDSNIPAQELKIVEIRIVEPELSS